MSRASKITLGLSTLFTTVTIVSVHYVQALERETLHQGPIKDAKRVEEKRKAKDEEEAKKLRKRMFNQADHEEQIRLREQYEKLQPLSGEIVTKDGEIVSK